MAIRTVRRKLKVAGFPTDVDSAVLSDPTGSFGIKRNDTGAVVVDANTAMSHSATGVYEYAFSEPLAGISYTAYVKLVYQGNALYFEHDLPAISAPSAVGTNFTALRKEIAHFVGWGRDPSKWDSEKTDVIDACIGRGLTRFYYPPPLVQGQPAHSWSFLRPITTISTIAPYSTGTVAVNNGVVTLTGGTFPGWAAGGELTIGDRGFSVATRDSTTQLTLDDATVNVGAGAAFVLAQHTYDLPDDFGSLDGPFTYAPGVSQEHHPIELVNEAEIRRMRQQGSAVTPSDRPRYAAYRPKPFSGSVGQRWEVIFYPNPNAQYTLQYRYEAIPGVLSETNPYPMGGPKHAETIIESCLAQAEQRMNDVQGVHSALFMQHLAASIDLDRAVSPVLVLGDTGTTNGTSFSELRKELAYYINKGKPYGGPMDQWDLVDACVKRGVQSFYYPPPLAQGESAHSWSFLHPVATLSTAAPYSTGTIAVAGGVATLTGGTFPSWAANGELLIGEASFPIASRTSGTEIQLKDTSVAFAGGTAYKVVQHAYDLPSDFGAIDGGMTFLPGVSAGHHVIELVKESEIRRLRQEDATIRATDRPRYVAYRPKTFAPEVGQRWEALFYPTPNAAYTLEYRYKAVPAALSESNQVPLGGPEHAGTIVEACLAQAEQRTTGAQGVHSAMFMQHLAASIDLDRAVIPAPFLGDTTETAGTSFPQLRREVAYFLNRGRAPASWATDQWDVIDACIKRGIQTFYYPPPLVQGQAAHSWSFLRPLATITTAAPYSTGTVSAANGVVTLSGGIFPAWAASGELSVGDFSYPIAARVSGTELLLEDTSVSILAGSSYRVSQHIYDLPEDFGSLDGLVTYLPGVSQEHHPIELVNEAEIRRLRQQDATIQSSDRPRYVAYRPKPFSGAVGQRWEALFHPTPNAAYSLQYRYKAIPGTLSDANLYPMGGPEHAETIVEACLAQAEQRMNDGQTVHSALFLKALAASIDIDRAVSPAPFLGDTSGTAGTSFQELRQEVAYFINRSTPGVATNQWDVVDACVKRGVQKFYYPPPLTTDQPAHSWSFLRPVATMSTAAPYATGTIAVANGVVSLTGGVFPAWAASGELVVGDHAYAIAERSSGTQLLLEDTSVTAIGGTAYKIVQHTYDLPDDFGNLDGTMTFLPGVSPGHHPIELVNEAEIRRLRQQDATIRTDRPRYVAYRPKSFSGSVGQRWEALFYPTPDAAYALQYRYKVIPGVLSEANPYPMGGPEHAETIVEACLAQAEQRINDGKAVHAALFMQHLAASIDIDRAVTPAAFLGDTTETTGTSFAQLRKEVAYLLGRDTPGLALDQWDVVDACIKRGLQTFYYPPPLSTNRPSHVWSFLRPSATLETAAPYSTGTVAITNGVVTLSGGMFPSWAAEGELMLGESGYSVATRDGNAQLTLNDTSLNVGAGTHYVLAQGCYDLPEDFGNLEGPMTYPPGISQLYDPVEQTTEAEIRRMRQRDATTTSSERPRWFAVRPKEFSGSVGQRWEVLLHPIPNAAYSLGYRYKAIPGMLSESNPFPLGGPEHAETIVEACLAQAELRLPDSKGVHLALFMKALTASVDIDRKIGIPDSLGYNGDGSERARDEWDGRRYIDPNTICAFNGQAYYD